MTSESIIRRQDGSYVIIRNGYPFHVPRQGEYAGLWTETHVYALAHPDQVEEEAVPDLVPPALEEVRASAVAAVKQKSWRAETAGIRLNGTAVATDRQSQAMLTGAVVGSLLDPDRVTRWQTGDLTPEGTPLFVVLSATELKLIARAVQTHVQACFDAREAKCAALAAMDSVEEIETWLDDNLETGWPQGGI